MSGKNTEDLGPVREDAAVTVTARDAVMAPFRMSHRSAFVHEDGTCMSLRESRNASGDRTHVEALVTALSSAEVPGWRLEIYSGVPADPVPAENDGMTAEVYHDRMDAAVAQLRDVGVHNPDGVRNLPAGWTSVIERACAGIAARVALPQAGDVHIQQTKEKFGTLRFYVFADGGGETFFGDIQQIADWAEAATEGRCCVTGAPGAQVGPGWVLTLSPEMAALRNEDMSAFHDRLYPPAPTPGPDLTG
ncbi:hypothetical protein OCH239_10960 [Roseivivax halodurans JCM 10272]|uniref:Uncharacterized protein n=1 Tax=Roseivivax halodurans JCM 10272 TaxID=1449350 RepID=X7EBX3_9RHOB|nr:hypothetical protein [Roseivivax halodurans]ETX13355.1 hypothetical protein OCH239_10960 [Roseivivax halodurans JCM 10272]